MPYPFGPGAQLPAEFRQLLQRPERRRRIPIYHPFQWEEEEEERLPFQQTFPSNPLADLFTGLPQGDPFGGGLMGDSRALTAGGDVRSQAWEGLLGGGRNTGFGPGLTGVQGMRVADFGRDRERRLGDVGTMGMPPAGKTTEALMEDVMAQRAFRKRAGAGYGQLVLNDPDEVDAAMLKRFGGEAALARQRFNRLNSKTPWQPMVGMLPHTPEPEPEFDPDRFDNAQAIKRRLEMEATYRDQPSLASGVSPGDAANTMQQTGQQFGEADSAFDKVQALRQFTAARRLARQQTMADREAQQQESQGLVRQRGLMKGLARKERLATRSQPLDPRQAMMAQLMQDPATALKMMQLNQQGMLGRAGIQQEAYANALTNRRLENAEQWQRENFSSRNEEQQANRILNEAAMILEASPGMTLTEAKQQAQTESGANVFNLPPAEVNPISQLPRELRQPRQQAYSAAIATEDPDTIWNAGKAARIPDANLKAVIDAIDPRWWDDNYRLRTDQPFIPDPKAGFGMGDFYIGG